MEFPRDPIDEPILNLAIQEHADYIIARDKDLFDLGKSKDFRLLNPYLQVVDLSLALFPVSMQIDTRL
jgi:predicted nucleic acid-binding protein